MYAILQYLVDAVASYARGLNYLVLIRLALTSTTS